MRKVQQQLAEVADPDTAAAVRRPSDLLSISALVLGSPLDLRWNLHLRCLKSCRLIATSWVFSGGQGGGGRRGGGRGGRGKDTAVALCFHRLRG